jgi:hypothetical protein
VLTGALSTVIVVYWLTTSEPPRPAPVAPAASAALPTVQPPVFAEDEPTVTPTVRAAQGRLPVRTSIAPPPAEPTIKPFVGSLQIDSTPQGARVVIDGKVAGVTPLVVPDLVAGSHVLRLEAEGAKPWSSAIRVVADRQTDVRAILTPSLDSASVRP